LSACNATALATESSRHGYSGTSLAKKLGVSDGLRVWVLAPPVPYRDLLGDDSPAFVEAKAPSASTDLVHLFVTERAVLATQLRLLRRKLRGDAAVWVSWPKKASKVATDVTEDVIRAVALPLGFVDIKVCALDETWSGLKLVVRRELRARE
jgi:hypothetical protein